MGNLLKMKKVSMSTFKLSQIYQKLLVYLVSSHQDSPNHDRPVLVYNYYYWTILDIYYGPSWFNKPSQHTFVYIAFITIFWNRTQPWFFWLLMWLMWKQSYWKFRNKIYCHQKDLQMVDLVISKATQTLSYVKQPSSLTRHMHPLSFTLILTVRLNCPLNIQGFES